MAAYIVRRLLLMIPLLLGVTFITFALVNLLPGSPISDLALNPRLRPADVERIERTLGLDRPWPARYVTWLGNLVRGDLGVSLFNATPVRDRILAVMPNTLLLTASALALALALSVPLGIYAAARQDTWFDRVAQVGSVAAFVTPSVWLGLLLVIVFSLKFREWGLPALPTGGMRDLRGDGGLLDRVEHLILPAVSLALAQIGFWASYVRSTMLEVLRQDYVRTARAKGLRDRAVLYRHAARNAIFPLVTLVGLALPSLFGGAVLVESIFAWNGVGLLTIQAVTQRDYTLVMGTTLMLAFLTMVANLIADIVYAVIDPRIRYD
jgi:peptide/nickel transport system permease protein